MQKRDRKPKNCLTTLKCKERNAIDEEGKIIFVDMVIWISNGTYIVSMETDYNIIRLVNKNENVTDNANNIEC